MPPLTETAIKAAQPKAKAYRLADEKGLYLEVSPAGGKYWRFKFRFAGKEKRLALGVYPDTGSKLARKKLDDARRLLAEGIDPSAHRKVSKAARSEASGNSFEAVALEWLTKNAHMWTEDHGEKIRRRLQRDLFPWIGARPIGDIAPGELLTTLRRIENRGRIETAHRALQNCSQVFRYAVATGRAASDPSRDLRGALPPVKPKHHASITDAKGVAELLRDLDAYKGAFVTACALRLAPLLFVRPGELRKAEWTEFDLEAAEWRIPAGKMKARVQHIVPLASQAVAILRELEAASGRSRYVFPGLRSVHRPMSENTVNAALRRMGYERDQMTGHGFRSIASTMLNEQGWNRDAIERQLAHGERDSVRAAYNYAEHLPDRRRMMQAWADYLDALKKPKDDSNTAA
ncbi:MAG: tyrosine-type recombinase/integrase [Gammaproteobacteria bacterium]